jgi:AbrB family looped-hinge helix DNA binding protein
MEDTTVETVTISPKYQIVIPRKIREALGLRPGVKVQVFSYQGHIELIPIRRPRELRGFVKGIDTTVEREGDRL